MYYSEKSKLVPLVISANYGGGFTSTAINMKDVHAATVVLTFGTVADGGLLYIESADQAAAGGNATNIIATGRRTNADIGNAASDTLSHDVDVTSGQEYYTINDDPFSDKMVVFEIPATKMTDGRPWLRLRMTNDAANGVICAMAICNVRYNPEGTIIKLT